MSARASSGIRPSGIFVGGSPAGPISQTARGLPRFSINSARERRPTAPSLRASSTGCGLRLTRRTRCSPRRTGGVPLGLVAGGADHPRLAPRADGTHRRAGGGPPRHRGRFPDDAPAAVHCRVAAGIRRASGARGAAAGPPTCGGPGRRWHPSRPCRGALVPPLVGPILIHFLHRLGALAVALGVIVLSVQARGSSGLLRRLIWAAVALMVAQFTLGALTISPRVAPPVTVLHLFTAVALFGPLGLVAGASPPPPGG